MKEMKCTQYESAWVLTALTVRVMLSAKEWYERQSISDTHRQEGVDNVCFDRTQRFVSDHYKYLLLFLQADKVPKPGLLGQPGSQTKNIQYEQIHRVIENIHEHKDTALHWENKWHLSSRFSGSATYSGLDSGVRLDMSSDVGTKRNHKLLLKLKFLSNDTSLAGSQKKKKK